MSSLSLYTRVTSARENVFDESCSVEYDNTPNKHPKYGNGYGYHRRSNGRKRKRKDIARARYALKNPSRCSKMSGVWEKDGRLVWYSYHIRWFRKYSDSVIRNKATLEIPNGGWYRKIFDYSWACW